MSYTRRFVLLASAFSVSALLGCGVPEESTPSSSVTTEGKRTENLQQGAANIQEASAEQARQALSSQTKQDQQTLFISRAKLGGGEVASVWCGSTVDDPWYDGTGMNAWAQVNCWGGTATVDGTICLERSNGTTVGCTRMIQTFPDYVEPTWSYWAWGCRTDVKYRAHFIANGVDNYSNWAKPGC